MNFRMWGSGAQHQDFELIDSLVTEQYIIGGVDMWLYLYEGPASNPGSNDKTKPNFLEGSQIDSVGNLVWGENAKRTYNKDAITLPFSYQQSDAALEMQIPGLFLFDTTDITVPYSLMVERCGRKIIQGDVIEMPHHRDRDLLNSDNVINRFYVVHDAFFAAEGYSPIYTKHIWKLRLVPLTDSPEFSDLLGDPNDEESLGNKLSSNEKELALMDAIISQADSEVPYIHWNKEAVYTNTEGESGTITNTHDNNREGMPPHKEAVDPLNPSPYEYISINSFTEVTSPIEGAWYRRVDMKVPLMFTPEIDNGTVKMWRQFVYGGRQPWAGPDLSQADLLNNRDVYLDGNVERPSRQNIHSAGDFTKPDIDDI